MLFDNTRTLKNYVGGDDDDEDLSPTIPTEIYIAIGDERVSIWDYM